MAHRKPGTHGLGHAASGAHAHANHPAPPGSGSVAGPGAQPKAGFVKMRAGNPDPHPYVDPKTGDDNQCAIKLSVAPHATGIEPDSFKGASVKVAAGKAVSFARFTLGMRTGPGFSDLGKATRITLREIR